MKSLTTLLAVLSATMASAREMARNLWNLRYSPPDGYLRIHHRSQKKQRIINRRRCMYVK